MRGAAAEKMASGVSSPSRALPYHLQRRAIDAADDREDEEEHEEGLAVGHGAAALERWFSLAASRIPPEAGIQSFRAASTAEVCG
jgi:hypothetical protein